MTHNNYKNYGGYGYHVTNSNIRNATGKYFIFIDNDDIVEDNHIELYLSQIENTDYDMVYFNSIIDPLEGFRLTELKQGYIGHSEVIVKTEVAKKLPPHEPTGFHDWKFVNDLVQFGAKIKKSSVDSATYHVRNIFWINIYVLIRK